MTITELVSTILAPLPVDTSGRMEATEARLAIIAAILAERERIAGMAEFFAENEFDESAASALTTEDEIYFSAGSAALRAFAKSIRSES